MVMVMIYVVAALTWAVVATTVASTESSTNTSSETVAIESTTGENNDRRPILQPRRFRHEASAVRVLYQTGVSISIFRTHTVDFKMQSDENDL